MSGPFANLNLSLVYSRVTIEDDWECQSLTVEITMQETKEAIKAEFNRAKGRVIAVLAATPDDKVNWSPSPDSRTPLEIACHVAMSIDGMQGWLDGKPFPFTSMKELDDYSRAEEKKYPTREAVLELLEKNSASYLAFVDAMPDERVASIFESMMGNFPMAVALTFPADHTRGHTCQMEYVQTIYGDRDMHMG